MKKLVLTAAAVLLAVSANAKVGIVAGLTSATTSINDAYNDIAVAKTANKYHAGLVYELNLPLGLSVQPGIIYNVKGQSVKDNIALAGQKADISIDTNTGYLEVPVRVAWGMNFGLFKPFVFAEPFVGYALTTETVSQFKDAATKEAFDKLASMAGTSLDTKKDDPNRWANRNRFEYGVGLGAGVKVLDFVALSVKYYWDLGQVYKESDTKPSVSAGTMYNAVKEQKCSGISASVTLYF